MLNKFSRFKPAMTVAEVLITIGVIGVIAAIVIPVLIRSVPSRNETKMKKMTYVIEQVVTQLFNDDVMYPRHPNSFDEGFQNTEKVTINGTTYGGSITSAIADEKKNAKEKFCKLFATKFNVSGDVRCQSDDSSAIAKRDDASVNAVGGYASGTHGVIPTFTSVDGVEWYLYTLPSEETAKPFDIGYEKLVIDVNGPEVPNCIEGGKGADATGHEVAACTAKQADRFVYYIKANGTVTREKPAAMNTGGKLTLNITPEGDCTGCTWCVAKITDTVDAATGRITEDLSALPKDSDCTGSPTNVEVDPRTKYIIKAVPSIDYISPWQMNRRRVIINNTNATVTIPFKKRDTRCIAVKVTNCGSTNIKNCVNLSLKGQCYFEECSGCSCPYSYDSDGAYNYVGANAASCTDKSWKYTCSGDEKASTAKSGIPDYNTDGTLKYDSSGNIKLSQTDGAVYVCGLVVDNYMLEATGKSDYVVSNGTTKKCTDGTMIYENKYSQDIKLGPSNLLFNITVGTGMLTSCPTE